MKLVILDRDGVINVDSDQFIKSPEEWKPIPGSLEAISRFNQAGYRVIVATHQSGVGRGLFDMAALNNIHRKMHDAAFHVGGRIDAIFFCPHAAEDHCGCRKPKTGMYVDISQRFNMSLQNVPAIGDSLRDLQAASMVGAQPVLVLTGKGALTKEGNDLPKDTLIYADLLDAAKHILAA